MTHCVVCRGSKRIRVAVYQWAHDAPVLDLADSLALTESSREYPCPECSASDLPYERLAVVKISRSGPENLHNDRRFLDIMSGMIAHAIGAEMYKRGLIRFERSHVDLNRGQFEVRATVGIVAPAKVAEFEERVAERQFEVAEAVVAEAAEQVRNWGSHYHGREGGSVGKWQAVEWLQGALAAVRAKYAR